MEPPESLMRIGAEGLFRFRAIASSGASTDAMYSASFEECSTVVSLCAVHVAGPPRTTKMYLVNDFLSMISELQSESE
jgi:hypothetical protein